MAIRKLASFLLCAVCLGCNAGSVVPVSKPAAKAPPPAPAPLPEMVQEKAQVGVGAKGHELGEGLVSTPVKTYFIAKERIVFEIQIPHAIQLYEATNGHKPRTQEEFMEQIIKFNAIPLPQLPSDSRYVYDPEAGELMVEHPKRN